MSWLYSIIIASLFFSAEGNPALQLNSHQSAEKFQQVVKFDETERFDQTYPLNADGRVSVSNVNGSITIETWDSPQVRLEAIKTADSREKLAEIEIRIDAKQNYFQVEADYGNLRRNGKSWNGKLQAEFKLTVPRNAVLDEIETVNGSIYISNAANTTKASTVNGQIRATNLRGTANLSTVNGTVNAEFDQLQSNSRISLDTVNGTVNLLMPSDANATVKADTVNGSINNEFGLPVRTGKYVGKDLYGKIGSGEVQIKLSSVNGGLSVRRRKDGKSVNPTINLLPAKNSDDDWDNDGNGQNLPPTGISRPPMPPNTEVFNDLNLDAQVQKEVLEALKLAQKEMRKITPEVQKEIEKAIKSTNLDKRKIQEQLKIAQEKYKEAMAQMSNVSWSPKIERKSESFQVKGVPKIIIDAKSSAVRVRGWDKSEVQYSVTKISNTSDQIPLNFKAEQNGQNISISFANNEPTMPFSEMNRVRIEVFVPKKSNLKIITSGAIRLEDVSGEIDLNGADEAINVRDSEGKMQITSDNGAIRVVGFNGEIGTKSTEGVTSLEGNFQNLTVQNDLGIIILSLPNDTNADIESNRKEIIGEGFALKYAGNKNEFSTWKIGSGGANFRLFTSADGQIFVRAASIAKN